MDNSQSKKFEDIKHIDDNGHEYWLARELQVILGYAQWRRFCDAIDRAMVSCKINEQDPKFHFAEVGKLIEMPSGIRLKWQIGEVSDMGFADVGKTYKEIPDYRLTRFACYLIVMNGDPRKEPIAHGQMYFAIKTRQELGANLFRITQTEGRLKKENIKNKDAAGKIHYHVGKEVRSAIERIGGTMPEDLPTPEKSIKEIQKEQIKEIKKLEDNNNG